MVYELYFHSKSTDIVPSPNWRNCLRFKKCLAVMFFFPIPPYIMLKGHSAMCFWEFGNITYANSMVQHSHISSFLKVPWGWIQGLVAKVETIYSSRNGLGQKKTKFCVKHLNDMFSVKNLPCHTKTLKSTFSSVIWFVYKGKKTWLYV